MDADSQTSQPSASTSPSPVGRRFPGVSGRALSGERVRMPDDLLGAPALLLIAYRRGAQDDVDRWVSFTRRAAPELKMLEVPAIPALIWRPFRGVIDGGMRGGVPRDQWSSVVTLYGEAAAVRDFVGDRGRNVTHATLLDSGGVVRFFEAGGFDDAGGRRLLAALAALNAG